MTDEAASGGSRTARVLGWLPAGFGVLAVVGAALAWFAPTGVARSARVLIPVAHSWQAGRIGFLAPLALTLVALAVLGPRHGWFGADRPRTLRRDGLLMLGAGVLAGAVLALTWYLLPQSYSFSGLTWDELATAGFVLRRHPQPGYFLAVAAAAGAVATGVTYLVLARRESGDATDAPAGIIGDHDGDDPGR